MRVGISQAIKSSDSRTCYSGPRRKGNFAAGRKLLVSLYEASSISIVDLAAKGCGALTYVFLTILVVPLFTGGLWEIYVARKS